MAKDTYKHTRVDETTGEENCFFPMEVTDPIVREWAKEQKLEICTTRLGYRSIEAVMVPCKEVIQGKNGREHFLPTDSDVQKTRYHQLIKDEMKEQEYIRQHGRCFISDGKGGIRRCPLRVPNPDYTPENGQLKTLPVKCEGCQFEKFKRNHVAYVDSSPDYNFMDDNGYPCEATMQEYQNHGEEYERLKRSFLEFVSLKSPNLTQLADLLTDELTKREISRKLGTPESTISSRTKKLKQLLAEFLEESI